MTPVRLEPAALRSRVKHSTTEPLRFQVSLAAVNQIGVFLQKSKDSLKACFENVKYVNE